MAALVTLQPPSAIIPVGTTTFSTTDLSAAYSQITMTLPRNAAWADSAGVEILEFLVEYSLDGGLTFPFAEGFGISGGPVTSIDKTTGQSVAVTQHVTTRRITTPCRIRGKLINKTGGSLTALSVSAVCT